MLSIENLTWKDAKGWGFDNLSLHVGFGEALIINGPNGSGKSTLLRILAGLIDSQAPKIEVPFHYIGHKLGLIENLSTQENLKIVQGLSGKAQKSTIAEWSLSDLLSQKVRSLSKGQKQRVALSRLTHIPKPLWILDEPTSGLDAEMKELFCHHLESHLEKGGSAILALHEEIEIQAHVKVFNLKTSS